MTASDQADPFGRPFNCAVCGSLLKKPGAKKCVECKEYQSELRQFVSTFNVGTLTSLISVATLCVGFLYQNLDLARSEVTVTLLGCSANTVEVAYANVGTRPGLLRDAKFLARDKNGSAPTEPRLALTTPAGDSGVIAKPGDYEKVRFEIKDLQASFLGADSCVVEFAINIYEFGASEGVPAPKMECPCQSLLL